ncbi:MAG: rod shape-determining protein RodA [Clostridiales bacterium]|nr:rod shape-determining protein RodA [Clostridiales bacterium]
MKYAWELIKNVDKLLLIIPAVLGVISVIMIGSTAYDDSFTLTSNMKIQMLAFGLGYVAIFIILFINYEVFYKAQKVLFVLSILLLISVYIPGLGDEQYGTQGWLDLGPVNLQPSELVKISFTLVYAAFLSRHEEMLKTLKGIILAIFYACPFIGLVLLQGDLGNALVYFVIMAVMLFYAGAKGSIYAKLVGILALCMPIAYKFLDEYQKDRIDAFLNPDNLQLPGNWQVWNSKIAIGSGGFAGKGLFEGTQKSLKFLPVQESDFIFSVIVEELGMIGGAFIIAVYSFFLYRITRIIVKAKDSFGALVATGILAMFFFQIFENIGMTMGVMPVTGVTLPFVSYGGSSVLTNMVAIGLVLNVGIRNKEINF